MLRFRTINVIFLALLTSLLIFSYWQKAPWPWATVILAVLYGGILLYGSVRVSAEFFLPILWRGNANQGAIAITFDDGPLPDKTEKILQILKEHQVKAAFFCIGNRVEKNPEIVKQIHREGHIIGNHSFTHAATFDLQSSQKMSLELRSADEAIERIVSCRPRFFRPPYGVTNPNLAAAIRKGGYRTIGWSVRSFDTITKDKIKLFRRVTNKLKAGDIILFHDYCDSTIEILPDLLDHVSRRGLKVVRADELLNEKPYA